MARDIGTDDPRVRVRPGRGSRPRTKIRPDYSDAARGFVTTVDRGRYGVIADDGPHLTAVKARELGRGSIVVGDRVGIVGDLSGRTDTLARIAAVDERSSALTRSAEDGDTEGVERVVVANADQLVVVVALADPPPRPRLVDRFLVAAYDAGMRAILVLTKADLAEPEAFLESYRGVDVDVVTVRRGEGPGGAEIVGIEDVRAVLNGHISVLVGHSGVGKSTLVNALVPGAGRATGGVNVVTGRGRHTSSSAIALELPEGGWVIDTPGVRSFGLAHVEPDDLLRGFGDLATAAEECPRGCSHALNSPDCALDEWVAAAEGAEANYRTARLDSYRRLLVARHSSD
nr:ribosome small subunit-dependent GTPase A [Actinomycetales bacterium]